jgi:hypothetical protein
VGVHHVDLVVSSLERSLPFAFFFYDPGGIKLEVVHVP